MIDLKLTKLQSGKWLENIWKFAIPLAIFYLGQITGTFQAEGNVIEWSDFIPSSFTLGAMSYYLTSVLVDFKKKLDESNKS